MNNKKKYLKKPITPQDAEDKLLIAAQIIKRLRETSIKWQTNYGAAYKQAMQYWERKADDFLTENIAEIEIQQPKILID